MKPSSMLQYYRIRRIGQMIRELSVDGSKRRENQRLQGRLRYLAGVLTTLISITQNYYRTHKLICRKFQKNNIIAELIN